MSVEVDWANEAHTIAVYTFSDPWTWDEFYRCWERLKAEMDASERKISVIMDLRKARAIPPDIMKHLRAIIRQVHPNFSGGTAYVGIGMFSALYPSLVRQLAPELADRTKAFFVPTLEEARQLLDDWNRQQESKDAP